MSKNQNNTPNTRFVSIFLGIGIFLIPFIFSFFTLRKGYSNTAKGVSFAWLALIIIMGFNGRQAEINTSVKATPSDKEHIQQSTVAKPFLITKQRMDDIENVLLEQYGLFSENKYFCSSDSFCETTVGGIVIRGMSYRIEPNANPKVKPLIYHQVCSAALIALTGAHKDVIEPVIVQHFNVAIQNGTARSNVLGVDFRVKAGYDGLLECVFIKP